jgi:hypothetical protein
MDSEAFDRVTRLLSATGARRTTLGALLGAAALPASSPLLANNRNRKGKGKGKGKKGGRRNVLVCHSGETLRVPRYAVRAIKRDGGFVGPCPPGGSCAEFRAVCSILGDPCCSERAVCTPNGNIPLLTTCQIPCDEDATCAQLVGADFVCATDVRCAFIAPCCVPK